MMEKLSEGILQALVQIGVVIGVLALGACALYAWQDVPTKILRKMLDYIQKMARFLENWAEKTMYKLPNGFGNGVGILWRGRAIIIKISRLNNKLLNCYFQRRLGKPIKDRTILVFALNLCKPHVVPVGFIYRKEINAAKNFRLFNPGREIPVGNLHPIEELYTSAPNTLKFDKYCMGGLLLGGEYGACSGRIDPYHIEKDENLYKLCRYHRNLIHAEPIPEDKLLAELDMYYVS
jgi:hypothetical protein